MICVKTLYLSLNRLLLLAVGLWPYEQSKLARLQLILLYSILVTFIIFQFTTFVTSECTQLLVIDVLSIATFFITCWILYNMFYFNMDTVRNLLEILQRTYDELRDENEIAIIKNYGIVARHYTGVLILFGMSIGFAITFPQFWSYIRAVVLPVNETRPHPQLIRTEYFIDQEKYFYLIALHTNAAFLIGGTTMIAIGTMLIMYLQYACGMFKIACYRMENAITSSTLRAGSPGNKNLISKEIIYAIDIHRNAMGYINLFMSEFNLSYLFLVPVGTIHASLNLFRGLSSGCDGEKLILPFMSVMVQYLHILVATNCAQKVTDHNDNLFCTVYNSQWYIAPLSIQKLVLFLLQKGTKPFKVNIAGLLVISLETAATVTSTSITYFTVLYSMQ